jgi:hypothetical protein
VISGETRCAAILCKMANWLGDHDACRGLQNLHSPVQIRTAPPIRYPIPPRIVLSERGVRRRVEGPLLSRSSVCPDRGLIGRLSPFCPREPIRYLDGPRCVVAVWAPMSGGCLVGFSLDAVVAGRLADRARPQTPPHSGECSCEQRRRDQETYVYACWAAISAVE